MKKLKTKVFFTIFLILTVFTFGILFITNYRSYQTNKENIINTLNRLPISLGVVRPHNNTNSLGEEFPRRESLRNDTNTKFFLDSIVYTIILDDDGNYKEVINHTENEINEEKIKLVAEEIIETHNSDVYIGNLYFEKYAYCFNQNNALIIIDNTSVNSELVRLLINTFILFIFLEIIVLFTSYILTKWIIKPVINSFEKQKEFIEDASHELKTPLSIIIASADTFYINKEVKWVDNIKSEAERMTKLVTNLLDLAKTEKDNKVTYSTINISKLVENSLLTFDGIFYENKIKLDYNLDENIDFKCNKEQIQQLVYILLDNAVSHSSKNGNVIVNLKKNKFELILEVKNKGLPIKKEDCEKIFERFYRIDESRNRNSNHYGLGLAIAKNIVENHNGTIKAYSQDGYTTFKINWNRK